MATDRPITLLSQIRRWVRRAAVAAAGLALLYAGFLLLGFVPVNRGYSAPPRDNCVRIYVRSNEVHTDLVLPVVCDEVAADWRLLFPLRDFWGNVKEPEFVAFGWGNRDFYVNTPTWAEFRLSTACRALFWPSETVLHVEYLDGVTPGDQMRPILLTREQYRELADFVAASVGETNASGQALTVTEFSYGRSDRFYSGAGRYHCFNTCNQWTGRGLKRAGVPTGLWTPLKPQVLYWLPAVED
ncbi:MAG TPA: TIGR02117 family protein [Pirellulaceae bacterium]|nr:TIGR02117 family protein [Pirellulaceae bacterium]